MIANDAPPRAGKSLSRLRSLIVLAALLLSGSHSLLAQEVSHAMLKLRLSDGTPLSVNIDGQFIDRNTSILRLDGLSAGRHKVEVYKNRNNRKPRRIFTGTISLDPGTVYIGLIDLYSQRLRIKTRPYDPLRDGSGVAAAPRGQAPAASGGPESEDAETGFGSYPNGKDGPGARPDFSANSVPAGIIAPARLTALEKEVLAKPTEAERITLLKSRLSDGKVSVAQVDAIFGWLNFESTRLEFLEWVRPRVADPEHLGQLEYRFSLEENREAFRREIGS